VFHADGVQGTGGNAIPASHAKVLKNDRGFEFPVDLLDHLMGAGRHSGANPLFRVALPGVAFCIVHDCEGFFGLQAHFSSMIGKGRFFEGMAKYRKGVNPETSCFFAMQWFPDEPVLLLGENEKQPSRYGGDLC
jgi:hypothetical protein